MTLSLGPLTVSWGAQSQKPTTDTKIFALGAAAGVATTLAATYLAPLAKPYVAAGAFQVYSLSANGCQKVANTVKSAFVRTDNRDSYVHVSVPAPATGTTPAAAPRTWSDTLLSVVTLGLK